MDLKTIVVFRRWKGKPHTLIALFPEIAADRAGTLCSSYEHVGQHGAADYRGVLRRSGPVTRPQAEQDGLYWELTRDIGYQLDVRMRAPLHRASINLLGGCPQ